jgi:hypothetical protein
MTHRITGEKIGDRKPWVAKIVGKDPKFGLARQFVEPMLRDYSGANSVGSRGIEYIWELTEPGLYEYSLPWSWKSTVRGFGILSSDGWREIKREEALQFLAASSEAREEVAQ